MDIKLHILVKRKRCDDSCLEVEEEEFALVPMVGERIEKRRRRRGSEKL